MDFGTLYPGGFGSFALNNSGSSFANYDFPTDPTMNPFALNSLEDGFPAGSNDDLSRIFDDSAPAGRLAAQWGTEVGLQQMSGAGLEQRGFPFPFQAAQMQRTTNNGTLHAPAAGVKWAADAVAGPCTPQTTSAANNEAEAAQIEGPEKPKRGRPKKPREKKVPTEAQLAEKREMFLERNRQAAGKCRNRKKKANEELQAKAARYEKISRDLGADLVAVRTAHTKLLEIAQDHARQCGAGFAKAFRVLEQSMTTIPDPVSTARCLPVGESQGPFSCPNLLDQGRDFLRLTDWRRYDKMLACDQSFEPPLVSDNNSIASPVDLEIHPGFLSSDHKRSMSLDSSPVTRVNSDNSVAAATKMEFHSGVLSSSHDRKMTLGSSPMTRINSNNSIASPGNIEFYPEGLSSGHNRSASLDSYPMTRINSSSSNVSFHSSATSYEQPWMEPSPLTSPK